MKPLAENVLIVPAEGEYTQAESQVAAGLSAVVGGRVVDGSKILRPEQTNRTKPSEGIVRAIGPDVKLTIVEGDRVLYRSWTGIEVRITDPGADRAIDHQLTPQRDVLAIVEKGERVEVIERALPAAPNAPPRR